MSLAKIIYKKPIVVLGLNSGTSADGVDLAAVRLSRGRKRSAATFLAGRERKYTPVLRELVTQTAVARRIAPEDLLYLDQALGRFYGRVATAFVESLRRRKIFVDAIASHGQTVRHCPEKVRIGSVRISGSMQLGSLEQIAGQTGRTVVGDFRQADIALGNEGAPITVAAMKELFAHPNLSRLIVNIGGIANYFYFPSKQAARPISAADCGPGNSLSDLLASQLFGKPYDRGGMLARKGTISRRLLTLLETQPFFRGPMKSTGKEAFGPKLVSEILQFGEKLSLSSEDLLATASEFTVRCIALKVAPIIKRDKGLTKLYLTGGGERNKFLRTRLGVRFSGVSLGSVRELGIPPGLVEAAAYAVMGAATLNSQPMRTVFGNRGPQKLLPVLGRIAQPPVKAGV
jgi:anhydro-N-acetylmuramic acid kinase